MAERPAESAPAWLRTLAAVGWRVLVVVAVAALVLWLAARLYLATAPVLIAGFLATVAVPAARWMERLRMPRLPAAAVTVLGGVIVSLGLIGAAVPLFASQMSQLGEQARQGWESILQWLQDSPVPVSADQLRQLVDRATQEARGRILTGALTGVTLVGEALTIFVLSVVLLFFFVKDSETIVGWMLRQVPGGRREAVRRGAKRAWATLTGYMHGLMIVAAVDAVAVGAGLLLIGVPLVVPLMLLTFAGAFIPVVGAFAAGIVAVLVALVSGGLMDALLVLVLYLVVEQLEGNFLQPVVMGRAVQLHPVVILLALTAGATVAGIAGAFLAVPVTAVLAAVGNELRADGDGPRPTAEVEDGGS